MCFSTLKKTRRMKRDLCALRRILRDPVMFDTCSVSCSPACRRVYVATAGGPHTSSHSGSITCVLISLVIIIIIIILIHYHKGLSAVGLSLPTDS
jgi:hypothetical protein